MCTNVVAPLRPHDNALLRMRWISKATDTLSEYVITYCALPLQQWLRERV
jgi:hypothetical protein